MRAAPRLPDGPMLRSAVAGSLLFFFFLTPGRDEGGIMAWLRCCCCCCCSGRCSLGTRPNLMLVRNKHVNMEQQFYPWRAGRGLKVLGVNSRIGSHVNPCIIRLFVFQYKTKAKITQNKTKWKIKKTLIIFFLIPHFVLNWKVDKVDNGQFSSLDNLDLRQGVWARSSLLCKRFLV